MPQTPSESAGPGSPSPAVARLARVLAEEADHLDALLGGVERPALALDVRDGDQSLDDRGTGRRRADP